MKLMATNSGGPMIPRSKSLAIESSADSSGFSRWEIPAGSVVDRISWSFMWSAPRRPRFCPMAT